MCLKSLLSLFLGAGDLGNQQIRGTLTTNTVVMYSEFAKRDVRHCKTAELRERKGKIPADSLSSAGKLAHLPHRFEAFSP